MGRDMKKKIVYISGGNAFDVNDVRAAFDEVRSTLNLDADTILFGVPVDSENESADASDKMCEVSTVEIMPETPEPAIENIQENQLDNTDETPVVPILSVLGGDSDKTQEEFTEDSVEEVEQPTETEIDTDITEMLNDDMPVDTSEKTLEELLETMAPLREDAHIESVELNEEVPSDSVDTETDATLENLASEFATTQIKSPLPKKGAERGRIGKLKNILPFKKIKRDDTGLMGDLFGWAGIAANDEDFTIPGFFTNAVGKK